MPTDEEIEKALEEYISIEKKWVGVELSKRKRLAGAKWLMLISKKKGFNDNKIEDLLRKENILLKEDKYPSELEKRVVNTIVERRKHKRVKFDAVVDLKASDSAYRYISKGSVKDISLGGLKFESCQELSIKDVVLSFGNGSFLGGSEIKGRIIRVVKDKLTYLYGVEFQELKLWEKVKIWYKTTTKSGKKMYLND